VNSAASVTGGLLRFLSGTGALFDPHAISSLGIQQPLRPLLAAVATLAAIALFVVVHRAVLAIGGETFCLSAEHS
jgi:hypothetical protein